MSQERIAIAGIRRAIGLQGYCAVEPFGKTFSLLKPPLSITVGTDEMHVREMVLENVKHRPNGYIGLFSEAHDRTQAQRLNGLFIYISEENLPPLEDGELYNFELKGMAVLSDATGETIGVVRDMVSLPSMDAMEMKLKNGNTVLIPYNDHVVFRVEKETRRIIVRWSYIEELLQ